MGRTATWQPQETAGSQPNARSRRGRTRAAAARSGIGESLLRRTRDRMPVALTLETSSSNPTRRGVLVRNGYTGPIFRSDPKCKWSKVLLRGAARSWKLEPVRRTRQQRFQPASLPQAPLAHLVCACVACRHPLFPRLSTGCSLPQFLHRPHHEILAPARPNRGATSGANKSGCAAGDVQPLLRAWRAPCLCSRATADRHWRLGVLLVSGECY